MAKKIGSVRGNSQVLQSLNTTKETPGIDLKSGEEGADQFSMLLEEIAQGFISFAEKDSSTDLKVSVKVSSRDVGNSPETEKIKIKIFEKPAKEAKECKADKNAAEQAPDLEDKEPALDAAGDEVGADEENNEEKQVITEKVAEKVTADGPSDESVSAAASQAVEAGKSEVEKPEVDGEGINPEAAEQQAVKEAVSVKTDSAGSQDSSELEAVPAEVVDELVSNAETEAKVEAELEAESETGEQTAPLQEESIPTGKGAGTFTVTGEVLPEETEETPPAITEVSVDVLKNVEATPKEAQNGPSIKSEAALVHAEKMEASQQPFQ